MNASFRRLGWSTLALFALVGCETATPPPPMAPTAPTPQEAARAQDAREAKEQDKAKNVVTPMPVEPAKPADPAKPEPKGAANTPAKLSDEEIAEIKKLPATEQPIALAQMACPVTGKNLGSMDMPVKEVVEGKTVFLCCEGCEKELKKDPATYLAKLKK